MNFTVLLSLFHMIWYVRAVSVQTKKLNVTKLDCGMRKLALDYSKTLIGDESIIRHVYDALRLRDLCKLEYDSIQIEATARLRHGIGPVDSRGGHHFCSSSSSCIYVTASSGSSTMKGGTPDGSIDRPWTSIHKALSYARSLMNESPVKALTIVLREGVHNLQAKPLELTEGDNGLTIMGFPGENVWISGGLTIDADDFDPIGDGLFVANLTDLLDDHSIPPLVSLFTTNRRYIRARFPNSDPEVDQWGYASLHRHNYSISSEHVLEWHRPKATKQPTFTFFDFTQKPPPGAPKKNNSGQPGYNWFASGMGGACSDVWGDGAKSYWCSNASQGGWAEGTSYVTLC